MSRHHGPPLTMPTSASGISLDPQSLERVVAGTRRKDGSIRKELKVRPGFTPEEDKARYRNTSTLQSARLKSFVPGSTSQSSTSFLASAPSAPDLTNNGQFPSLSAAQKKNLKRKDKRRAEREQAEAKDWDEEEGEDEQEGESTGRPGLSGKITSTTIPGTPEPSVKDPNSDPKQALRHLIQQTVTSSPSVPRPQPVSSSASTPAPVVQTPTSTHKPREKKEARPGGLFGAALRVSKPSSNPGQSTSDSTTSSDLSQQVDNLTLRSPTTAESTPTTKPEKKIKPGSEPYHDVGNHQPKSNQSNQTPTARSRQPKPTPPGATPPTTPTTTTTSTKPTAPARTRSEIRVRPGGGLGGLVKEIVEKNAGGK